MSSSLSDARDALLNAVVDGLGVYRDTVSTLQQHGLMAPDNLRLFPLYVLALLKQVGPHIRSALPEWSYSLNFSTFSRITTTRVHLFYWGVL